MVFSVTYTICKGLNYMPRDLEVPRPLIINMTLFAKISNFFKHTIVNIITCSVAHRGA